MARTKANDTEQAIIVESVQRASGTFYLLGTSPLILHKMSQKAMHELLLPAGRRNAAQRAATLKHNPIEEYRASVHRAPHGSEFPTRIMFPASCVKAALADVALDLPNVNKSVVARLTYVTGDYVPVWGIPQLHMGIVRMQDINRTPDVRTRAILSRWAMAATIEWVEPILTRSAIGSLLHNAGIMRGVGEWRPQKGKGSYGQFVLCDKNDSQLRELIKGAGAAVQDAALSNPEPYDDEARELLAWFDEEVVRRHRGQQAAAALVESDDDAPPAPRRRRKPASNGDARVQ